MLTANLEGMRIGLCQRYAKPADPQFNANYFIREIEQAEHNELDILFGDEGLQGYLIGDQYDYPAFLREVDTVNHRIQKATIGKKLAVVYGSLTTTWGQTGEDGRVMRHNGGYVLQDGQIVGKGNKTLSPNYRMFPEARHFFSNRHWAEKLALQYGLPLHYALTKLLPLVQLTRRNGQRYRLAQIFCEDGWPNDYAINPLLLMSEHVEPGEDWVAVDHSASPWTWRKNNKRHRTIGDLIRTIPKERRPKFVAYDNRVGIEQAVKNIYIYDGSSALYDSDGDLIFEARPYETGTKVYTFGAENPKIEAYTPDDTKAMYDGMACVIDNFFGAFADPYRFVYVGLSGGIDSSAVVTALVSRPCLGNRRVIGVNMPYGDYNCQEGKDDAKTIAERLGIAYLVVDITDAVDRIAKATGVEPFTLAHENIQARVRMEILAALAQKEETLNGLEKRGGVFTANGNKVEMTFGYGTLYGDIAGVIILLADLVKREVYQLADYMNRFVYGREIIPPSVFVRIPTAELKRDQKDPYFYGSLEHRGYHDEWVRAVTEFRWDPERFLTEYRNGTLEKSFVLEEGSLKELFPTAHEFVRRLEKDWSDFTRSYFKRDRAPFIPVFTRRAYGGDLLESMYAFPPTEEYLRLREEILATEEAIALALVQKQGGKISAD